MMAETTYQSCPNKWKRYLPSILLVGQHSARVLNLRQKLENRGCQVYRAGVNSDELRRAGQKYFELIVLILDQSDDDGLALYEKLKSYPALANIPTVVLAAGGAAGALAQAQQKASLYFLTGQGVETALLSIIEQVHYLTHRYL